MEAGLAEAGLTYDPVSEAQIPRSNFALGHLATAPLQTTKLAKKHMICTIL